MIFRAFFTENEKPPFVAPKNFFIWKNDQVLVNAMKHGSFRNDRRVDQVFAKSMIFRAFSRIEPLFTTFGWKVHRSKKHQNMVVFSKKLHSFCQIDEFSKNKRRAFSRNDAVFQLFAEKCIETSKHGSFLEKLQVLTKSMSFRAFSRNEQCVSEGCLFANRKIILHNTQWNYS